MSTGVMIATVLVTSVLLNGVNFVCLTVLSTWAASYLFGCVGS